MAGRYVPVDLALRVGKLYGKSNHGEQPHQLRLSHQAFCLLPMFYGVLKDANFTLVIDDIMDVPASLFIFMIKTLLHVRDERVQQLQLLC